MTTTVQKETLGFQAEVKQLLAEYIEDKRRGKLTFHDYVKKCKKAQDAAVAAPTSDN